MSDPAWPGSNGPRPPLLLSYLYSKYFDVQQLLIFLVGEGGGVGLKIP